MKRRFVKSRATDAFSRMAVVLAGLAVLAVLAFSAGNAFAESCLTSSDMDAATRTSLTSSGLMDQSLFG